MKRSTKWGLIGLGALASASAMAGVTKGGTLYIKGSGVNVWAKSDASGTKTAVPNGTEVKWQGADEKNKSMHKVEYKNKPGYVQQANLTPSKPIDEYPTGDGKPTSAQAFASSGAASKAMTEAGLKYAQGSGPKAEEVAAGIIYLEGSTEDAKKTKVADHVKKTGLGGAK